MSVCRYPAGCADIPVELSDRVSSYGLGTNGYTLRLFFFTLTAGSCISCINAIIGFLVFSLIAHYFPYVFFEILINVSFLHTYLTSDVCASRWSSGHCGQTLVFYSSWYSGCIQGLFATLTLPFVWSFWSSYQGCYRIDRGLTGFSSGRSRCQL